MSDMTQPAERRAFGRRRSCIHAYVLVAGRPASPCVVRDFSGQGAMVELSERLEPPFNIELSLTTGGDRIPCEVRHVRAFRMGVRFTDKGAVEWIERALGLRKRARKGRGKAKPTGEMTPTPRVTGTELRRRFLKQPA